MSEPYVGEIRLFAGNFAPNGWVLCDGRLLVISDFDVLYLLLGTTYGGDGVNTFAVPDLRGRVPVHAGPGFVLGQRGGAESVTLTVSQIPAHNHVPQASSGGATATNPSGQVWATWGPAPYSTNAPGSAMAAAATGGAGGGLAHDNMIPFVGLNFILAAFGIFPSQ